MSSVTVTDVTNPRPLLLGMLLTLCALVLAVSSNWIGAVFAAICALASFVQAARHRPPTN